MRDELVFPTKAEIEA